MVVGYAEGGKGAGSVAWRRVERDHEGVEAHGPGAALYDGLPHPANCPCQFHTKS